LTGLIVNSFSFELCSADELRDPPSTRQLSDDF